MKLFKKDYATFLDPENRAIPKAAPQAPVPGRRRRPGASARAPKAPTWAPKAPTGHQAAQMWLPWYHYLCWVLADGLDSATLTCPSWLPDLSCPAFPSCFGGLSGPLASDKIRWGHAGQGFTGAQNSQIRSSGWFAKWL